MKRGFHGRITQSDTTSLTQAATSRVCACVCVCVYVYIKSKLPERRKEGLVRPGGWAQQSFLAILCVINNSDKKIFFCG